MTAVETDDLLPKKYSRYKLYFHQFDLVTFTKDQTNTATVLMGTVASSSLLSMAKVPSAIVYSKSKKAVSQFTTLTHTSAMPAPKLAHWS